MTASPPLEVDGIHPTRAELLELADSFGWPAVAFASVTGAMVRLLAVPEAWRTFTRRAVPADRLAAYTALEALEGET